MTVLSAGRNTLRKEPGAKSHPVAASTTIYIGGMVCLNASGYAVPAADTADFIGCGVARETVDNSAGAAGALRVTCDSGIYLLVASSITQADVGRIMFVVDDQTFDNGPGTNSIKAGVLVEYVSATSGWIQIRNTVGIGITQDDADGTYGAAEQALINEMKGVINYYLT